MSMSSRLQVITRCYFPPGEVETYAGDMMASARRLGMEARPFGVGEVMSTHGGSGEGPGAIQALSMCDAEFVLCCDCMDVALLADADEIVNKFLAFGSDFVVSTEKAALRCMEPTSEVLQKYKGYNKEVNVGLWIGRRTHAIEVLEYATDTYRYSERTSGQDTLQTWLPLMYADRVTGVTTDSPEFELDRDCVLFQSMAGVSPADILWRDKRACNVSTGTWPVAIHYNGNKDRTEYKALVARLLA